MDLPIPNSNMQPSKVQGSIECAIGDPKDKRESPTPTCSTRSLAVGLHVTSIRGTHTQLCPKTALRVHVCTGCKKHKTKNKY